MNDHFRDTAFGQAVRLLSRNRLLKFPDELDPTLWKKCVQRYATAISSTSEKHDDLGDHTAVGVNNGGERTQGQGDDTTPIHGPGDKPSLHQGDSSHERTTHFILVDWYGPDDQEV
jgi:MFS transporter, DHA1 family, multidrug resistance protein